LQQLVWYAWHLPLALVVPQTNVNSIAYMLLNSSMLALGSICTFIFLAYVYVKSRSIFVVSLTHIVLNNSAASFSYFVVIEEQMLANLGLMLTMLLVVTVLYVRKEFTIFEKYFSTSEKAKDQRK
jgi:hypothetical protein